MAIASKPKRNAHYKKTRAAHHRHSKTYLKSYWPYLPMLAIMGGGIAIDRAWTVTSTANTQAGLGALTAISSGLPQTSARIQTLTGNNSAWLITAMLLIAVTALTFFMVRRTLAFHKAVIKSEHFINDHPMLDIAAVFIFTAGFVLAR